jgi:FkbM family methyltransferase
MYNKKLVKKVKLNGLFYYLFIRAKMRLHYSLMRREVKKKKEFNSKELELNISDLEQFYVYNDIIREPENVLLFEILAKSGLARTFIDVGANYGHLAKSISGFYDSVILIDANPSAANFLNQVFSGSYKHTILNKAIVRNPAEQIKVKLNVPVNSSGLGTVVHDNSILAVTNEVVTYEVSCDSLSNIIDEAGLTGAFVKVDVEGMEFDVISSAGKYLSSDSFIYGFEALSINDAKTVSDIFKNHKFYFARFSFVNDTGALSSSFFKILNALIVGGFIEILKVDNFDSVSVDNYSQIIAIPNSLVDSFESGIEKVLIEKNYIVSLIQ